MPQAMKPWIRRSARVIRMVGELHRMGFQRLRVMPYEYPLAYRVAIGPADRFRGPNGAYADYSLGDMFATYSAADEESYFSWSDAAGSSARQLAEKFLARFAGLCEAGSGRDWQYAGWLADLEGVLERFPSRLPVVMGEMLEPEPELLTSIPLRIYGEQTPDDGGGSMSFPLPPRAS